MHARYLLLDATFLAAVLLLDLGILRTRVSLQSATWKAAACLGLLTLFFDNLMTGLPIVTYNPEFILGLRLGYAPVEDFAYALAASILVPALYRYFLRRNA